MNIFFRDYFLDHTNIYLYEGGKTRKITVQNILI